MASAQVQDILKATSGMATSLAKAFSNDPANLGCLQRIAKWCNICYSPEVLDLYQRPLYLVRAAKAKYGQDIFVLGATKRELATFWEDTVNYRAIEISEEPTPKGRTIVDIDTKSHLNDREEDEEEEVDAPDRNDKFEITSTKGSTNSNTKTYQLKFNKSYTYNIGGSLELKPQFFNMAGGGIGISGSLTKQTSQETTHGATNEETLSQEYQLVEKLVVPPKTKVKATIKTYAVTYEGKSVTEVSVPKWARIPVHYRTMSSRQLGGILITTGFITARELFRAQPNFREEEEMVYFVEETKVSYIGEDVQILKEKQKVD